MIIFPHITVGFDGKRVAQNRTGLGNYSRFFVRCLSRLSAVSRLKLYVPSRRRVSCTDGVDKEARVELLFPRGAWRCFSSLWRIWGVTSQLERDKIDIFHGLSGELPLNIGKSSVRSVVTIHDLIFRHYPECYHFIDRKIYNYKFRRACLHADQIIAVSECTKRDVVRLYGIPEEKITVVYQGCDERFSSVASEAERRELKQRYNLPDRYILFVGSIERRKNLLLLVRALRHLPKDIGVIAVGRQTSYAREVKEFASRNGLSSRLRMISGVPFNLFPALYQQSSVFVYPSRYEGFGIPILEALVSGVPVVACTGSCLEEAGGPSSLYVDPDNDEALASSILQILSDSSLRTTMIEEGKRYATRFSAEKLTKDLLDVYQKVWEQP